MTDFRCLFLCLVFSIFGSVDLNAQQAPLPPFSNEVLKERTFNYFWKLADPTFGQVPDRYPSLTFSSIAAGEALLNGKPAITLGPNAAAALCSQSLDAINDPYVPTLDEVERWAAHMAYCQFTEAEMRDGTAWRILQGG